MLFICVVTENLHKTLVPLQSRLLICTYLVSKSFNPHCFGYLFLSISLYTFPLKIVDTRSIISQVSLSISGSSTGQLS